MKARVKETGEIIKVQGVYTRTIRTFGIEKIDSYDMDNVDVIIDPDYWTRLEHQYAGMAMQGILGNPEIELDYEGNDGCVQAVTATAARFAHALVEKMKEERK